MKDNSVTLQDGVDVLPRKEIYEVSNRRKVVTVWSCVNMDCRSGYIKKDLITADPYSLSFFGAEAKEGRKRKVCVECKELAMANQRRLVDKLIAGENIFEVKLPVAQDILLLEDSDEELCTDSSDEEIEIDLSDEDDISANKKLESGIKSTLVKYNLDFQLSAASHDLASKIDNLVQDIAATGKMYSDLQRNVDNLRSELFREHEPRIRELSPVDIEEYDELSQNSAETESIYETKVNYWRPGQSVLIASHDEKMCWITSKIEKFSNGVFTVVLPDMARKIVKGNRVAYLPENIERLTVGTRCVALDMVVGLYKRCVVAKPPTSMNKHRYLIFYDNGDPAYVERTDIAVLVEQPANVWEDVEAGGRELIREYLRQYPGVPTLDSLSVGQQVKAEMDGKWWMTEVLELDCKLVLLRFDKKDNHSEWLFLGSTRLGPLFANKEANKERKALMDMHQTGLLLDHKIEEKPNVEEPKLSSTTGRMVAKKSSSNRKIERKSSLELEWESEGSIFQVSMNTRYRGTFTEHTCSNVCISSCQYLEDEWRGTNPLLIPLMLGWDRQIAMHNNRGLRKVFYLAPCGRRLSTLQDIHKYIAVTGLKLEMDFFNFDWWLHVLNEWKPSRQFCNIKDISYGKEAIPIPCINSIDGSYPEYVEYSTIRLPQKKVNINTEVEFLTGCECQDDCVNTDKCSCRHLTIQSTKANRENKVESNAGYEYRRLQDIVQTGIYECNKLCKCSKTCLNRVAQNPLRLKLQVFKTAKRGWGLRTLNDIPGGTYICNYVGNLYSTQEGNTYGKNFGDEYFADLDLIEVVESRKEGYESDVSDEGFTDDVALNNILQIDDTKISQVDGATNVDNVDGRKLKSKKSSSLKRKSPAMTSSGPAKEKKKKFICTRKLFGADEMSYVMDAKTTGNIGRYLNHSCHPNVFVQNVFVDTHDLRFPWLAFYTSTFVRAGQELCWDYGYEVGSIEDKEIYCSCGAFNCRGRLL